MTVEGLKTAVAEEMIQKFREWLDDYTKMSDRDYCRKYGWGKALISAGSYQADEQEGITQISWE